MSALTSDRNTPRRDGEFYEYPVAAGAVIHAGGLTALNSAGLAIAASDSAGLKVVGRAEISADNTGGANSAIYVRVRKGVFGYEKATTNTPAQADVGADVYVTDDQTVATASTSSIKAGTLMAVDALLAWIKIS